MIRLFATDLDGTLMDHQGHVAQEDIDALHRARDMGVTVVVASGRLPATISELLHRLGVKPEDPVVGGQGAIIARQDGQVLRTLTIPQQVAEEASTISRSFGAIPVYYTPDVILMERIAFSPEKDAFWLGQGLRYDPDALAHLNGDLIKVLIVQKDTSLTEKLLEALRARLGGEAEVVRSHHWFTEIVNKDASKGAAIAWIAQQLGISQDEVLAIGDAENDISMLEWAGIGVATADAAPEARAAADWIAPPQAEHPVAAALARFLNID